MDELHVIKEYLKGKKILILGFGREGQSTFQFLCKLLPDAPISIADSNENLPQQFIDYEKFATINWYCGIHYLQAVEQAEVVIKSPGIPLKAVLEEHHYKVTSQTELFIQAYKQQICGITGTKGKSTTSSLLYHIFLQSGKKTLLVGNIGIPPFSVLDEIDKDSFIVYELSCHQLQAIHYSPSSAILLNIFQEHLDHYKNLKEYQLTKINIGLYQEDSDYLVYHAEDEVTLSFMQDNKFPSQLISYSLREREGISIFPRADAIIFRGNSKETVLIKDIYNLPLKGDHNLLNCMAAAGLAYLKGISAESINFSIHNFQPLEHRLEAVGLFHTIYFYNDSISTIPESTVEALKTLKEVDTLIVGGIDRGIGYTLLTNYLAVSGIKHLIITGEAGKRIKAEILSADTLSFDITEAKNYKEVIDIAINKTAPGKICLLSPAAASYDWFKNFEERGKTFKSLIKSYSKNS